MHELWKITVCLNYDLNYSITVCHLFKLEEYTVYREITVCNLKSPFQCKNIFLSNVYGTWVYAVFVQDS